MTIPPSDVGDW